MAKKVKVEKDNNQEYTFHFVDRPAVTAINFAAVDPVPCAFINLNPCSMVVYKNGDKQFEERHPEGMKVEMPAFFISDGVSTPSVFEGMIEPQEGIVAGHWHDYLYSKRSGFSSMIGEVDEARKVADLAFSSYAAHFCPDFNGVERKLATLALRLFGGKSFEDRERDAWRQEVAKKLSYCPGSGLGEAMAKDGTEYAKSLINFIQANFMSPILCKDA